MSTVWFHKVRSIFNFGLFFLTGSHWFWTHTHHNYFVTKSLNVITIVHVTEREFITKLQYSSFLVIFFHWVVM